MPSEDTPPFRKDRERMGHPQMGSEVESDLPGQRPRRHKMRAAEGREKVVEHLFVGQIDGCELQANFVATFASEDVVVTNRQVEQVAWGNARRILVVILGTRRRDGDTSCL